MVSVRFKEEIKMKKILSLILAAFMFCALLVSCGNNSSTDINVYSREKGSGTRGAFIELFGIEQGNVTLYVALLLKTAHTLKHRSRRQVHLCGKLLGGELAVVLQLFQNFDVDCIQFVNHLFS